MDNRRAQLIDQIARSAGADPKSQAAAAGWISYFPDLGDDPHFDAIRTAVMDHMRFNIVQQYGRRDGEKEEEARPRLKNIGEDLRKRFGGISSSGEEVEEYFGTCGDALMECQRAQISLFRQVSRLHLLNILMGRSDDAIEARTGKLGYAWDYFDGAAEQLEQFLLFMDDVKRRRDQLKPELKIAGLSDRARRFVDSTAGKKILWFWEHPDVRGSELSYLQAQQRLMEMRREDILHSFVVNSARQMKAACEEIRDSLQRWIWHLATGDAASQIPGLWDGIQESQHALENAHSYDVNSNKVQRLVSDTPLVYEQADIEKALKEWEWTVEFEGEPPCISIKARLLSEQPGEEPDVLDDPMNGVSTPLRMEIGRQNQRALLRLSQKRFIGEAARANIAEQIKQEFPNSAVFASQVANESAEPLFDGDSEANPRTKSNLIRVMTRPNDPYYIGANGLEGHLRNYNHLDRETRDDVFGIQVVGSENPYKLTLVRTNDLHQYNHFAAWAECQSSYAIHMEKEGEPLDPVLMQNFAAEARAVEFERRITRAGEEYRPLHPRVVMLLEDPEALRQFIYLGMMGLIKENAQHIYRWELTWQKSSGPQTFWLTKGWNTDVDNTRRSRPDIFNAIHGYVIVRINQEPKRKDRIDYEFARQLIDNEMKKLTPEGEIKLIKENMEDGFVSWLRSLASDPDVTNRMVREDFTDLAVVTELMLNDRLEKLKEEDRKAKMQTSGRSGPFRTIDQSTREKTVEQNSQETGAPSGLKDEEEDDPGQSVSPRVNN